MSRRNLLISYALSYLNHSWFWLGVWVFYYLLYTDYAGIGLIETVLILTIILTEIPTGAISDLLGKKITLSLSFLLSAICNFYMAVAPNYLALVFSVFIGALGITFYSGAFEALIYDSLKQDRQQHRFDKAIANTQTISLIAMAISGSIGGFMYAVNPSWPFIAVGVASTLAFFLSFFLIEPSIDTEKFSLDSFISQNRQGITMIKKLFRVEPLSLLLIIVGSLYVISDEILENILGLEFGFSETQVGVFFAIVFVIAAFASQLTPLIIKRFGKNKSVFLTAAIMAFTYLLSPFSKRVLGGFSIIARESSSRNLQNLTSVVFNQHIPSKYRATTLSTYNMLKNIPYLLSAFLLGSLMDIITAKVFAFIMGVVILIIISIQYFRIKPLSSRL
jgi:MFS family permease